MSNIKPTLTMVYHYASKRFSDPKPSQPSPQTPSHRPTSTKNNSPTPPTGANPVPLKQRILIGACGAVLENCWRTPAGNVQIAVQTAYSKGQSLGITDAVKQLYYSGGSPSIANLFKGYLPATLTRVVQRSFVYSSVDYFAAHKVSVPLAALITTVGETAILTPTELYLRLLATSNGKAPDFFKTLMNEGFKKVLNTGAAGLVRNFMFNATMASNNSLFAEHRKEFPAIFSILNSLTSVIISHPFDVIQQEVVTLNNSTANPLKQILDATKSVLEKRGLIGFTAGGASRISAIGVGSGLSLMFYNKGHELLSQK